MISQASRIIARVLSPVYWAGASLKQRPYRARSSSPALLSPVYWAGASLKLGFNPLLALDPVLSPVYWAGASLKQGKRDATDAKGNHFPRSTGPGPH